MSALKEYLRDNPQYIEILKNILEYEDDNKKPDHAFVEDKEYDTFWSFKDVSVHPSKLYQLEVNGFITRVFDSNSNTSYVIKDRDAVRSAIQDIDNEMSDGMMEIIHEFPDEEGELDGVFDSVIGYDDVKWLLKRGMTIDKITNFLLVGPPGSAKTVFLLCINKLPESEFVSGAETSGAGFIDVMFEEKPKYVSIDELDDMPTDDQKSLSQYTETGILKETKYGKQRQMKTNTKTFASANSTDSILNQIEDRFVPLHFEPYTEPEFREVCEHLLPMEENTPPEEAGMIADLLWDRYASGDVRRAIAVARLSRGDPEKVVGVLDDYSEPSVLGSFG